MELKAFLDAIGGDTVSLLSGVGSVILLILGLTVFYNKTTPRWVVLVVAAICFFCAAARVWTSEYRARTALEKKFDELTKPNFEVTHHSIAVAEANISNPGISKEVVKRAFVLMPVTVVNHGAPSVVYGWKMTAKLANGMEYTGDPWTPDPSQVPVIHLGKVMYGTVNIPTSSSLFLKGANGPIPQGGIADGYVSFVFPLEIRKDLSMPGTVITLEIYDVNMRSYKQTVNMTGKQSDQFLISPSMAPK